MKKIGIISYFNYYNYGSMLQGYALQKYISQLDKTIDCENINYRHASKYKSSLFAMIQMRISRFGYYFTHLKEVITKHNYSNRIQLKKNLFDKFLHHYTNTTDHLYSSKEELLESDFNYDVCVTGSDQTWSPIVSGGYQESPMFLDFLKSDVIKAAYAPSLGVANYTNEQKSFLKEKLADFRLISCRETNGAKFLSNLLCREVPSVLDPTLLLIKQQWEEIEVIPPNIPKDYIFCYFIGHRKYYRDFAIKLSKQTNLPLFYIPVSWRDCKKSNNLIFEAGPREFVGLINHATYVCTDSFHGVAFCSNLGKNFYAFVKHSGNIHGGDNSRLFDYLERIGLTDRLFESYTGDEIDIHSINYSLVEEKLAEERKKSYAYLNELIAL